MAALFASICLGATTVQADESASGGPKIQQGHASWYQHGRRTANGEAFNPNGMTAAHRSLPFGSLVRVTAIDGLTLHVQPDLTQKGSDS